MENNAELISPSSELELVHGLLNDHFYEIRNRTLSQLENDTQQAIPSVVLQTFAQDGLDYLQQLPLFPGTTDEHDAKLLENLKIDLNEKINYIFNIFEGFESSIQILIDSAPLVLSRAQDMEFDSLVSFVGFGQDDYFAKSIRTYLRGHYGGITRCRIGEPFGAESGDMSGSIATFAQSEAIHGFVRGAHVSMINEVCGFVWDTIYQMITDDTDVDTADKVTEELRSKIEESQRKKFISPMLSTIGGLPLTGLAELAESLVGMQATFSAAGTGPASVGGFIESLIIDRSRGVRWVHQLTI
jgi:hypothetical protein